MINDVSKYNCQTLSLNMGHTYTIQKLGRLLTLLVAIVKIVSSQPTLSQKAHRNVCVSPYWPLSRCDNQGRFDGYEVKLFERAAALAAGDGHREWAFGNWSFVCIAEWDSALESLLEPAATRQCDVLVAGVSATTARKGTPSQPGIFKFSYATYTAGWRIMLHYYDKQSIWWWMEPLETKVWLLFFGTAVAMGVVILLVELPWDTIIQQPQATLAKASNLQWASAALLVGGGPQMAPRSPGGRVMLLAFGFLVLTIMNLYIAAATATLSAAIMRREQVNDISDLAMMRVGIFEDDLRELQSFALSDVALFPWATDAEEAFMVSQLRGGYVDALLLDAPWVEWMVSSQCDLYSVGQNLLPVDMGFTYPLDTPEADLAVLDSALSRLDDNGIMAQLERDLIRSRHQCASAASIKVGSTIKLNQVAGLWVILAAAVCLGFGWNFALSLLRGWQARRAATDASVHSRRSGDKCAQAEESQQGGKPNSDEGRLGSGCTPLFGPSPPGASVSDSWVSVADASTVDEAVQIVDARLRHVSNHIKHLPWIMSAVMDSKLGSLRHDLMTAAAAGGCNNIHATSVRGGKMLGQLRQPGPQGPASLASAGPAIGSQDSAPLTNGGGTGHTMHAPSSGSTKATDAQASGPNAVMQGNPWSAPEAMAAPRTDFVQRAAKRFGLVPDLATP